MPALRGTQVRSLGREDPREEEMATHSSVFGWGIQRQRSWRAIIHWVTKDLATKGQVL